MNSSTSTAELEKVLQTLDEAMHFAEKNQNNAQPFRIFRDACIQRFEYCIELAWKVSMKKIGSTTKFPKPAIREMARADLIESAETWLEFLEARNDSSHSYDEDIATKVYMQIRLFSAEAKKLIANLHKLP